VVGGDGLWNVHLHTDDAGAAIEAGLRAGRPHRLRVSYLDAAEHRPARRTGRGGVEQTRRTARLPGRRDQGRRVLSGRFAASCPAEPVEQREPGW
jgi:hypothetical protein